MYTIKHAAEVTGLSPATLRAWEKRYGVVTPARTESGYRLYDEASFQALMVMAGLVAQGWSPRQAADETRRRTAVGPPATVPVAAGPDAAANHPRPPRADAGRDTVRADTEAFLDAAADLDVARLSAILDERFAVASFESVVDGWLMSSLVALGEAWATGRVSVAGEHLASYAVMRRLAAAYDASSAGASGPTVVVGLPPGARHELGVLAFAVAARRAGLRAVYLGADLPAADWVTAVATHHPRAVVLSAQAADFTALDTVVQQLRKADPRLLIAVGGALQDDAPNDCLRLGHELGAGAARLAAALEATDASARGVVAGDASAREVAATDLGGGEPAATVSR